MSPSHAVKGASRYRYYITHASTITDGAPAWRIAAHDVERAVTGRITTLLKDRTAIAKIVQLGASDDAPTLSAALNMAAQAVERMESSYHRRMIVAQIATAVTLREEAIEIGIDQAALVQLLGLPAPEQPEPPIVLDAPITRVRIGKQVKLVLAGGPSNRDDALVALLAEAHAARAMILGQPDRTIKDIAASTGQCRHRLARLVKLSWASPSIVNAILAGEHPQGLTAKRLLATALPLDWDSQKVALGFG